MCGIVGVLSRGAGGAPEPEHLDRMLGLVRHRGPDAAGRYLDDQVMLGHARLSIVDLEGGLQPLTNEDEALWLVCNGEVFNHRALRADLEARGHRFRTGSDCETILHLYEEDGPAAVHALNGQFAFALWDRRRRRLLLGRDRLGIRPLFYTRATDGALVFASEIKALLAYPGVARELDPVALGQVFSTWAPVPPRTMFKGVLSLRPGHLLLADDQGQTVRRYWRPRFPAAGAEPPPSDADAADELRALLDDATRLRLQADVPVGAYVSGGLDSSAVAALALRHTPRLATFAVAFTDGEFDERPQQERVARLLGTEHHTITCGPADIAEVFPDVVWHAETPLLRTAPAPLFKLAGLVRARGLKVVLTGEGADEFLLGYDLFKETRVRAFWARQPGSRLRPRLLRRLYGHIPELARPSQAYLEAFFGAGLDAVGSPAFSHAVRWANTARLHRYFSPDIREQLAAADLDALLAEQDDRWDPVARAQHAEVATFLDPYLLSSQGDRVAMAHAVEGRFPFLDYRVVEFCNRLPSRMKLRGLNEKALLKRAVADLLPADIVDRPKQPFRAPIRAAFAGPGAPDYVRELLDPARVAADGVFRPEAVSWLLRRARTHPRLSETENMALVGLVSFGLFRRAFWDHFLNRLRARAPAPGDVTTVRDNRGATRFEPVAIA
jgi:asparagine synthase (glutamine-hydrolysing)